MGAPFLKIPRLLLEQNSGPGAHRRYVLYGHIQGHCSGSSQGCWASIATLARESGLGVRTVKRALRELLELGWVVQESRPGHTSLLRAMEAPVPNPHQTRAKCGQQRTASGTGGGSHLAHPPGQIRQATRATRDPLTRFQETRNQDLEEILPPSVSPPAPLAPAAQTTGETGSSGEQPAAPGQPPAPRLSHPPYPGFCPPEALRLAWERYTPEKRAWIPTYPKPTAADLPEDYRFSLDDVVLAWEQSLQRKSAASTVNWPVHPQRQQPGMWADDATAWQLVCRRIPLPLSDDDVWLPIKAADLPLPVRSLPRCLQGIADDLELYWQAKRGPRSAAAFRAAVAQLTPLVLQRGPLRIAAFLHVAAQAGYPLLDVERWEQRERGFTAP
jgi:hypothetical protein